MRFFQRRNNNEEKNSQNLSNELAKNVHKNWFYQSYPLYKITALKEQPLIGAMVVPVIWCAKAIAIPLEYNLYKIKPQPFFKPTLFLDPRFRFKACITLPILEEAIFRGWIMPGIQKKLTVFGIEKNQAQIFSVLGSSLLFSAMHGRGQYTSTFISGFVYGALTKYYDNSLVASTTAHITNNTAAAALITHSLRKR